MPHNPETTPELYGISAINRPVEILYGKKWWQFWKVWKTELLTPTQMQKIINERMRSCLERL